MTRYRWFPFAKGGAFSPFYSDLHLVVNWYKEGEELEADLIQKYPYLNGDANWVLHRECDYFRPGLTWPRRTNGLSFRALPAGSIFSDKGPAVFLPNKMDLLPTAAVINSRTFEALVNMLVARVELAQGFEVGLITSIPLPENDSEAVDLSSVGSRATQIKQGADTLRLNSRLAVKPRLLSIQPHSLPVTLGRVEISDVSDEKELMMLQARADQAAAEAYGIALKDLEVSGERVPVNQEDDVDEDDSGDAINRIALVLDLLTYLAGIAFGRWDVRYATGEKEPPPLPDPFAPLPVCPPGMLQGEDGLPLFQPPAGYPIAFPEHGIVVDDEAHPQGLMPRLREVFRVIYGDRAAAIEQEAVEILGARSLEDYFRRTSSFFDAHLKQYSKSRRKAPIYWPLSVPSGHYTLWLYYPRLTGQTLYTAINDFVDPKLAEVSSDIERLRSAVLDGTATRARQNELESLIELQTELQAFREELLRVAQLPYRPNLNDGVELTAAPLHNLFRHTPWQRHLKKRWEELEERKYDWAHLALPIWTERVKEACRNDKSIAIAHGLEEEWGE